MADLTPENAKLLEWLQRCSEAECGIAKHLHVYEGEWYWSYECICRDCYSRPNRYTSADEATNFFHRHFEHRFSIKKQLTNEAPKS